MDRRGFLKTTGTLLAGATIAPGALAADHDALAQTASANSSMMLPPRVLSMNRGWLYSRTAEDGATGRDCNDANFTRVVIPHTNDMLP